MKALTTYQCDGRIGYTQPYLSDSNLHWVHAGLSSLVLLSLPVLKRWHMHYHITEKLRHVTEALEQAEERALRFQDRHDRILFQLNSLYLTHKEMREALATAQKHMDDAIQFTVVLRRRQLMILALYPYGYHDASATIVEDNYLQ